MESRDSSVWRLVDWPTIIIYTLLVFSGMVSIYAASYDYDYASIFSLDERSGKQMMWIGCSFLIGFVLLMIDYRTYEMAAYPIYIAMMLLLLVTIFIAPEIKGSRSWLALGPFRLQPAEFAKFATALAIARFMDTYDFKLLKPGNFIRVCLFILLPMGLILLQQETGSALVYVSLILVLYREGMSGLILFAGVCAVIIFVLVVKYAAVPMWGGATVGEFSALLFLALVLIGVLLFYSKHRRAAGRVALFLAIGAIIGITCWIADVEVNLCYILLGVLTLSTLYLIWHFLKESAQRLLVAALFPIAFVLFLFSADYAFNSILEPHQQLRIQVALGMEDDIRGAGYNVNQSKIAIGSGGFWGKGILNGTQTKLKYVPEQDTDFIFCTIGEEQGFAGSVVVLGLFLALILRVLFIAERQHSVFGRVYGYCVFSILLFHLGINIGMVLGLCPVIGIPLPFFSYGGSSLWGFSILLFILLRIDTGRFARY